MSNPQGHTLLPLETLLISLEREGFTFGVDVHLRMQSVLRNLGKEYVREPEKLKQILAPILVKSQEEALKFDWVFDQYVEKVVRPYIHQQLHPEEASDPDTAIKLDPELRKHVSIWKRLFPLLLIVLFGGTALGLFLIQNESSDLSAKPDFSILSASNELLNDKHINLGDTITFRHKSGDYLRNLLGGDLTEEVEAGIEYRWDMGDGVQRQEKEFSYVYQAEGLYLIKSKLVIPHDGGQILDSVEHAVWVKCKDKPRIHTFKITPALPRIGELFKIEIEAFGVDPDDIIWIDEKEEEFTASGDYLAEEGVHTLEPRLLVAGADPCSILDTLFYVQVLNKDHRETLLEPENMYTDDKGASLFTYSFSYAATLLPALLLFALVYLIDRIRLKRRREKLLGEGIPEQQSQRQGPYEIPWPEMDYLLSANQDIYRLAKIFRQRRTGERKKLDIGATLTATARSLGMLDLKYLNTSKSSEYLMLIEQKHPQSHLTRLFDRYTHLLKDEDVELERFYFDSDMRICWNEDFPQGISLTRLRQRFPRHRLLLYTDGHHMIDPYEAKLKDWVPDALEVWKKRVLIISPVPPTDWGYKEKLLYEQFSLLSAQLADQDRLLDFYTQVTQLSFEDHRKISLANQSPENESLKDYDFEQIADLRIYLDDAMFEWLAATMVYPQPNWELTLALGRTLSIRTPEASLLTYDNLLRLSRIPWMQDGLLPPRLRMELLNQLDRETEHIARETVLDVLEEVEVKQQSYASKKLNVQQVSNQFLTSPVDEEIARKMYVLWQKNQIADSGVLKWMEQPLVQLNGEKVSTYLKTRFEKITPLWTLSKAFFLALVVAFGTYQLHNKYDATDTLKELSETYNLDKFYLTESIEQLDSAVYYNDKGVEAFKSGNTKAARVHFYNALHFRHYRNRKDAKENLSFAQSRLEPHWNILLKKGAETTFTEQRLSVIMHEKMTDTAQIQSAFDFDTLLLQLFVPENIRINGESLGTDLVEFEKYPGFDINTIGLLPAHLFINEYPTASKNMLNLALYNEGVKEFNNGNYQAALMQFVRDELLLQGSLLTVNENQLKPLYTKILHGVGLCHFYLGQDKEAISYKNKIIQQDDSFFVKLEKPREHLAFLLEGGLNLQEEQLNEEEIWAEVERIGTILAYESYLEDFPNGKYADQAREALERLGVVSLTLAGRVSNQNGEPLSGAIIASLDLDLKTSTNSEGNFTLTLPSNIKELAVSLEGYVSKTVEIQEEDLIIVLDAEVFPRDFIGHTQPVRAVAFSPDGKYVLTGSVDHTAKLWDSSNGAEIRTFTGHMDDVLAVAISPDGKYILTGSADDTAKLWDSNSGAEIRTFSDHTFYVESVAISPDGKYVLTGSADQTAKLWDSRSGNLVRSFAGHTDIVKAVAFSPDGKYVLTGSWDKTAKLWDISSGEEIRTFRGHAKSVGSIAFSPDARYMLTGSYDRTAKLWDISSGLEIRAFAGHTSSVLAVAFSPDGKFVLTGSHDRTAKLWDSSSGAEINNFTGHTSGVESVAFSPNLKYVLTGSGDKKAILWKILN